MNHRNRVRKGIHRFDLNQVIFQSEDIAELDNIALADNRTIAWRLARRSLHRLFP